jgi:integrase
MSVLRDTLDRYLEMRRGLGYRLKRDERDLVSFVNFMDAHGSTYITVSLTVAWVAQPAGARPSWLANRMTMARGFAAYLHAIDPLHEVPPADLFRHGPHRAVPYLYSDEEVTALIDAAATLRNPRTALMIRTLIALLAATGLRVGEALALDVDDLDLTTGVLAVRHSKFGRSRLVPLHLQVTAALADYLRQRGQMWPSPTSTALFLTITGTRKQYAHVRQAFAELVRRVGLAHKTHNCRPRVHDLRHTFAVRTLIDWYHDGTDVQARLPMLSAYLGHSEPAYTCWYLEAAPDLLAAAAARLEWRPEPS